jgi:hypothetical protein
MAYEGELVKLENGRWARFQECQICNAGHQDTDDMTILVAVELEQTYQELLDAAEGSLESFRERGMAVQVRLDPDADGKLSLSFSNEAVH